MHANGPLTTPYRPVLFRSFFLAGFECASHRQRGARRVDMLAATAHDRFADQDYRRLRPLGLRTVREGVRWHLVERRGGCYNFSSVFPMLKAARDSGTQVIWDLCHYGWPNRLDIFKPVFVDSFSRFVKAFTEWLSNETDDDCFFVVMNEPSYFAWAAGEVGYFYPHARGRGAELKQQLVRASIAGIEAIWSVRPAARTIHVDPLINVVPADATPRSRTFAKMYHEIQFEAKDMLSGRVQPELGGKEAYLDIVGSSYYPFNQWIHCDQVGAPVVPLDTGDPKYRHLRDLLSELYVRYQRPMIIAETGTEADGRVQWLRYVSTEAFITLDEGLPIEGICWYPILDNPGWDDGRHCQHGLWGYADLDGHREEYHPLSEELLRQRAKLGLIPQG